MAGKARLATGETYSQKTNILGEYILTRKEENMTDIKYLTCAETAKLVRMALKKHFPSVKFSVKSHVYAGGASIDVKYTDGCPVEEVEEIAKRFAGATFDGMTDCKDYHTSQIVNDRWKIEEVYCGADFVVVRRVLSYESKNKVIAAIEKRWGIIFDMNQRYEHLRCWGMDLYHKEQRGMSF